MVKPYLKYVGGKTQLAGELVKRFPTTFERYIEPFCGSAALFFYYYGSLCSDDMFETRKPVPAILNDINQSLLNAHYYVANDANGIVERLRLLSKEHGKDPEGTYQRVRSTINVLTDEPSQDLQRAAEFIYINKTCFNGLWRVNSKNLFNVPFNGKRAIAFNFRQIKECSRLLREHAWTKYGKFDHFLLSHAQSGDFVFLDPPYVPLSATSSFTGYTDGGWDEKEDEKLVNTLNHLDSIGVKFMMTNSSSHKVRQLFGKWKIEEVKAHRFVKAINVEGEKREKVDETITTNY